MALGISLLITALGAIMRYAYTPANSHGFNFATTGAILMIVGIVGGVISIVGWVASTYRHQRTTSTTEADGRVLRRDDVDTMSSPI